MELITLRGGHTTTDRRLDFLPHKDPRSRNYAAVDNLGPDQTIPRTKTWYLKQRLDQGNEGACVLFSLGHELACRPVAVSKITESPESAAWLKRRYHDAQRIDAWEGGSYEGADPFYEGTGLVAGGKILTDIGLFAEYRWAFGEEDLYLSIGHLGPAVIGVNWYEGMHHPDSKGRLQITGNVAGGHAILVRGVSVKHQMYRLTNSWGRGYGVNGEVFLSRADMARLLAENGECLIPVHRRNPRVDWTN